MQRDYEPRKVPKYDFRKITARQRNAINKLEAYVEDIKSTLKLLTDPNPNTENAISHLRQVTLQATAAILVHWRGKGNA